MRRPLGAKFVLLSLAGLCLQVVMVRADDPPAGAILASKGSKVYHNRLCSSAKKLNLGTALRFATEAEAQASGRRLCKVCAEQAAREPKSPAVQPLADRPKPVGNSNGGSANGAATSQPVEPAEGVPITATIRKVHPGGTLESDTGEIFGLMGVVCPQTGQPMVKETVRFIREQTRGRKVRIRAESTGARRDALGRLQVYLFAQPGERDLGEELLFQGLGWLDRSAAFDRTDRYLRQEYEGWWNRRGIWKQSESEAGNPDVVIGRHALNYHPVDCPHAAQLAEARTVKLNEAKAQRLTPCMFYRVAGGAATASRPEP